MKASDYNTLAASMTGVTQEDIEFRNAVYELGYRIDFYGLKKQALNRLNNSLAGGRILQNEVEIAGILDLEKNQLLIASVPDDIVYPLDELDRAYVDFIKESMLSYKGGQQKVPLSVLALELLDSQFKDVDAKPDLRELDAFNLRNEVSPSRRVFERAFANEMLFLNELEEYISSHGLDDLFEANKDSLTELVTNKAFIQLNEKDISDLHKEIEGVLKL